MTETTEPVPTERVPLEAFLVLCELADKRGEVPFDKAPACWECTFPSVLGEGRDTWQVAINGHNTPTRSSLSEKPIDPFHAFVYYNGWPAGVLTPYDGWIARGSGANEDSFVASVRAAIARAA